MNDINIGQITEALNNKVDLPTNPERAQDQIDYVVDWQKPTEENSYTWYRKYKSGWVEQGGRISVPQDSGVNVSLPIPLNSTGGYANWISCLGVSNSGSGTRSAELLSNTQVRFYNGQDIGMLANWEVKGMAAE